MSSIRSSVCLKPYGALVSRFDDRLLDHPVRERLRQLRSLLENLQDEQRDQAEEHAEDALNRAPSVIDRIEGFIEAADPQLVPANALGQLEDPATRAVGALEALATDPSQIEAFDGAIEDLLAGSQLLASTIRLPAEISDAALENFGAELRTRAQDLKAQTDAINTRLQELSTEQQRLEEEGTEAFSQRRSELQGEFDRIAEAVKTEQGRLDQLVPQFEKQFTDSQASWSDEWQQLKKELEEKVTAAQDQLEGKASEVASAVSAQADEVLVDVRKVRDEVVDLYRVIGDTGTAGAFADEADDQKKAADRWRRVAVAGAVLTIFLAVGAVVFSAVDGEGSVTSHLASLVVAAAAGGLTAYAARQSGHHRDREDETRRLQLELTAFGPFTNDLQNPSEARAEYAKRLFKGGERQSSGEATISKDQVSLLQTLLESLIKVRG